MGVLGQVQSLACSPSGLQLAAATRLDYRLYILSVASGLPVAVLEVRPHRSQITKAAARACQHVAHV